MSKRPKKRLAAKKTAKTSLTATDKLPLVEHLKELKRRVLIVVASILVGSLAAYGLQHQLISILLRPSHGQSFIYTSPLGGINFLFSACLDLGIALSIPLIVYQLLRFLQPLMRATSRKLIIIGSSVSGVIAIIGVLFGYFVGLPAALHFLLHQFTVAQIKPLITIQSYMSFVTVYLLGSALMFQLPLILLFINRIKPLKPSGLLHYERHVIVSAFIVGFIMNPTPNLVDQMLVVAPIILMYQLAIGMVWLVNRSNKPTKVERLLARDAELQAARAERARTIRPLISSALPVPPVLAAQTPTTNPQPLRTTVLTESFTARRAY